jgi:curved DNA-binding protein CbpA
MSIYHDILGVTQTSSLEEIKAAYRALCKKYHPDTSSENDIRKIALINEAYSVLSKPNKVNYKKARNPIGKNDKELELYKDQAYAFYKKGYSLYHETLEMEKNEIYGIFHKSGNTNEFEKKTLQALYYLNIVCMEYEETQWYEGSMEIIKAINRNIKFIKNIKGYQGN